MFSQSGTVTDSIEQWHIRALVVDDYEDFLRLLCSYLEDMGIQCERATRGEEAATLLENVAFDLLVVDKNLPDMDGISLARWARFAHPGLPVLLITGYPSEESAQRAAVAGVTDYIQKPFNVDWFGEQVRSLTGPAPASVRHSPFTGPRGKQVSTIPPAESEPPPARLISWTARPDADVESGAELGVVSVMLIERDDHVRDALAGHLEEIHCEVVAFAAPEAAEAFREHPRFDVLVARPEVLESRTGWLEPHEGHAPLGSIAIVHRSDIDDIVQAIRLGARGVLLPPFNKAGVVAEFTDSVTQLIEERYGKLSEL
jgi:DNA-binding NtrC family response regulator